MSEINLPLICKVVYYRGTPFGFTEYSQAQTMLTSWLEFEGYQKIEELVERYDWNVWVLPDRYGVDDVAKIDVHFKTVPVQLNSCDGLIDSYEYDFKCCSLCVENELLANNIVKDFVGEFRGRKVYLEIFNFTEALKYMYEDLFKNFYKIEEYQQTINC